MDCGCNGGKSLTLAPLLLRDADGSATTGSSRLVSGGEKPPLNREGDEGRR